MNTAYMTYFKHLAKLSTVANKQTMFLAYMLHSMEYDKRTKQMICHLTAMKKREIIKAIGAKTNDPLKSAARYITILQNSGLIKSIGGGGYLIDPQSYGYAKYVSNALRNASGAIYETRVFVEDAENGKVVDAYIITDDGERIDLT